MVRPRGMFVFVVGGSFIASTTSSTRTAIMMNDNSVYCGLFFVVNFVSNIFIVDVGF